MVEETIFVLKLCTMISVCCVVQITLLCPNFKINTDAIGFFVTHPLTMIHILDFYSLYGVVYKEFVGNKKELWEDQLTTLTCKMEILIFNVFFVSLVAISTLHFTHSEAQCVGILCYDCELINIFFPCI